MRRLWFQAWGLGIVLLVAPPEVMGQRAGARRPAAATPASGKAADDAVKIRRVAGIGRPNLVKTPVFRTNQPSGTKPVGEWARIMTEYDSSPEWLDELVFQYYVMTMDRESGVNSYSFFRKVVRYIDIERDRNHFSTVFLHPRTLERYGDVVAVAVEISVGGSVAAEEDEVDAQVKLPPKWWKAPSVLQNKNLTVRDGYLMSRDETPFAVVNVDDYEVIK